MDEIFQFKNVGYQFQLQMGLYVPLFIFIYLKKIFLGEATLG